MQINGGPSSGASQRKSTPLHCQQRVWEGPEFRTHIKSLKTKSTAPFTRSREQDTAPKLAPVGLEVLLLWIQLRPYSVRTPGTEESHRLPASWLELGSLIKSHLSLNNHMFVFAPFILGPWDFIWSGWCPRLFLCLFSLVIFPQLTAVGSSQPLTGWLEARRAQPMTSGCRMWGFGKHRRTRKQSPLWPISGVWH